MTARRRVAVVADSDTRWKWGHAVAHELCEDPSLSGWIVASPTSPNADQIGHVGTAADGFHELELPDVVDPQRLGETDVVILALGGDRIFPVIRAVRRACLTGRLMSRPVIVTGYSGVVYEREVEGFLFRVGADIICLNSRKDKERFCAVAEDLGIDPAALHVTGYPDARGRVPVTARPVRTLVFAVQPSVPASRHERERLVLRLASYAQTHPEREVVVKLRTRRTERTTHFEDHHFEQIARRHEPVPPNLRFVTGSMAQTLETADLLVTVSSTAALEALSRGIPVALLSDFGIRERYGNHFYVGAGLFASFDDVDADRIPQPRREWLDDNGLGSSDDFRSARAALGDLLRLRGERSLPPPAQYYDEERAPELVHSLDSRTETSSSFTKRWTRRGIRRAARGPAYRLYRRVTSWTESQ